MKHLKVALLALLLVTSFINVNAQDKNNPWAVSFGANAVDFYPTNPQTGWGGNWFNEFSNAEDHYNIIPAISKLTIGRYIDDGFSFEIAGTFNQISKMGDMDVDDLAFWGLDGVVKWSIASVANLRWWEPYLLVGGGYTWLEEYDTGAFNAGIGMNFWFTERAGINIESKLRQTFESEVHAHFQHSIGFIFKMGGTDTDGDGVYDKFDACPEVFGLEEFNGCPDTDGDGVIDSEDACPDTAGLAEFNGCPDTDGDGVIDSKDACPNDKGSAANNGCPDTDGDSVVDKDDKCPNEAGPAENKGCPWPDTDGDGVVDKDDKCPKEAGPASNNGCPEGISDEDLAKIAELTKGVYFKSESAEFTEEMPSRLNMIAEILKENTYNKYKVEGFCDSRGPVGYNNKLSVERAATVKKYLVSKGVSVDALSIEGFGKTHFVGNNATAKGRSENRRVEIKVAE